MSFIANNQLYIDLGGEIVSVDLDNGNVTRTWLKDLNKGGCWLVRVGTDRFASIAGSMIEVWDMEEKQGIELNGHTNDVTGVASLGNTIATSSMDGTVKIWDVEARACTRTIVVENDFPYTVSWFDDNTLLIGTCKNSTIIYDLENSSIAHKHEAEGIVFVSKKLSNGKIVTGDWAGNIKVYDSNGDFIVIGSHNDFVMDIREIAPGFIVSVCSNEDIKIWNIGTRECLETIYMRLEENRGTPGAWLSLAVSGDYAFTYTKKDGLLRIRLD